MTLPYITPPGLAPDRTDRISFAPRADAWTLWQQVEFVPKMNLIVTELAALSSVSTDLIAISEFKGYWSSLTGALAIPASVSHLGNFWMLLENVANVATEIPGTSSKWQKIKTKSELVCSPRTSNIMAVAADTGTLLDCSGTFTQTFDTGANLGNGWFAFVKNSGQGVITLQAVADSERVTNGSFTGNATGWTLGASWTYASNQVTRSSNAASSSLEQVLTGLTVGRVCYLTCTTANLAGTGDKSISVVGAGTTILRETSGTNTLDVSGLTLSFIADATTMTLKFTSASTSGGSVATVDGVSVMCAASGARSIDNLGSLVLYPNASGIVQNNGTDLSFIPLSGGSITFTSSQYFTAPYDGLYTSDVFAGGGGGGSGCRGAAGTFRTGGGGGAGGAHNRQMAKLFKGEKVYCTVGAGGTGGAGVATNNTGGVAGQAGGNSSFGEYCTAFGGGGGASTNAPDGSTNFYGGSGGGSESAGQSGSSSNPVAGLPTPQLTYPSINTGAGFIGIGTGGARGTTGNGLSAEWGGASGATSSTNGTAGFNGAGSVFGGASGGSGGGLNSSNTESIGGYGGARGSCGALTYGNGTITGGAGRAGRTGDSNTYCGDGGGGGGSHSTGAGGAGGAGGFPSSGGGGGGACLDNFLSGAGGVGGAGKIVISYGA